MAIGTNYWRWKLRLGIMKNPSSSWHLFFPFLLVWLQEEWSSLSSTTHKNMQLNLSLVTFFSWGFLQVIAMGIRIVARILTNKRSSSSLTAEECVAKLKLGLLGHEELKFFTSINVKNWGQALWRTFFFLFFWFICRKSGQAWTWLHTSVKVKFKFGLFSVKIQIANSTRPCWLWKTWVFHDHRHWELGWVPWRTQILCSQVFFFF